VGSMVKVFFGWWMGVSSGCYGIGLRRRTDVEEEI
jgi:hypothetical protein